MLKGTVSSQKVETACSSNPGSRASSCSACARVASARASTGPSTARSCCCFEQIHGFVVCRRRGRLRSLGGLGWGRDRTTTALLRVLWLSRFWNALRDVSKEMYGGVGHD